MTRWAGVADEAHWAVGDAVVVDPGRQHDVVGGVDAVVEHVVVDECVAGGGGALVALLAAGLTVTVTSLTATVLGAVAKERAGLASGVNNAVARTGGLLLVAVLPALTGLGTNGFADPATLAPAFTSAMLICTGLLTLGGAIAAVTLRPTRTPPAVGEEATCPSRHRAVDTSPVGATHRPPP